MTANDAPPTDPDAKDTTPGAAKRPTTRAGRKAASEAKKIAAKPDTAPRAPAKSGTTTPRKATLETRLSDNLTALGVYVSMAGAFYGPAVTADGLLIVSHSETVSRGLADVAKNSPRVAVMLERFLSISTVGALVGAFTPLAVGIAANHGKVPVELATMLGVQLPDVAAMAADAQAQAEAEAAYHAGAAGHVPTPADVFGQR